jgi:hypothetical protein
MPAMRPEARLVYRPVISASSGGMRGLKWPLSLFFPALACLAAVAQNPQAEQLIARGDAEVKARHVPEALAFFQEAEKADPANGDILLRISQQESDLISTARTPAEAEAYAKRSLAEAQRAETLEPQSSKAHLALAVAYGRLTDFEDNRTKVEDSRHVKSEAERALELNPKEDVAYHVLGRWNYAVATLNPMLKMMARFIYGGMPDASLEEAARNYKDAIALAPGRVIHHHELARVYVAMGKPELARQEWAAELSLKAEDNEGLEDQKQARGELAKK